MFENPFNKPSSKEKQENNLLSFEEAKKQIENGNAAYLAENFEKLSHLPPKQQFEIAKLIARNGGIEQLEENFEKLSHLSPNQQFEIAKLIVRSGNAWELAGDFEKLSHLSPNQQFEIAKLIAQDYFGVKRLTDNFEKLSQLKAISSEDKKELYTIFQNADIDKIKFFELVAVIGCETSPLFVFGKPFGKFINKRLLNQLEQALDKGCFK